LVTLNAGNALSCRRFVILTAISLISLNALLVITYVNRSCTIVAHFRIRDFYAFECCNGELLISRGRNIPISRQAPAEPGLGEAAWRPGSYFNRFRTGGYWNRWASPADGQPEHRAPGLPVRTIAAHCWHGFGLQRVADGTQSWWRVVMPLWLLTLAAAVLTGFAVRREMKYLRERQRIANRRCIACGYDLRASKDRCPECGTPIPNGDRQATKVATRTI